MDTNNSICGMDAAILKDLQAREQDGEEGFINYYHYNQASGIDELKQAARYSEADVGLLKDRTLHNQAKKLLATMSKAVIQFVKNPSDENLSSLKSDTNEYKAFLSQNQ